MIRELKSPLSCTGVRFSSYRLHILERRPLVYYVHFCRLVCFCIEPFAFSSPITFVYKFTAFIRKNYQLGCMSDLFCCCGMHVLGAALQPNFGEPPLSFDARGVLSITAALILICTLAFLYPHHVRPYLQHDQFSM